MDPDRQPNISFTCAVNCGIWLKHNRSNSKITTLQESIFKTVMYATRLLTPNCMFSFYRLDIDNFLLVIIFDTVPETAYMDVHNN